MQLSLPYICANYYFISHFRMAVRKLIQLNNGAWMPTLGLGTYLIDDCKRAIEAALDAGYRHIDTALTYENEQEIGSALKDTLGKHEIKRTDLFVTTKVPPVYLAPSDVCYSLEESLRRLKLSYVDLLLIHNPFGRRNHHDGNFNPKNEHGELDLQHHDLVSAWKAFEELVDRGLTKAIGLSNFTPSQIERIWKSARIKPANVQMELHCYAQQKVLREYCDQKGIAVTGFCPLGAPGRHRNPGEKENLTDPVVLRISEKHQKTPAQVLLRHALQLGVVPLPKSGNPERICENFAVYDFQLDKEDMSRLANLNVDQKYVKFTHSMKHPEYPTKEMF